MAVNDSILTTRNATLGELATLLEAQQTRKLDVVVAASKLRAVGGNLVLAGAGEPVMTPDGVTATDVTLRPTGAADGNIADKLAIPVRYLRRLREENQQDLYDHNVNTVRHEALDYRVEVKDRHSRAVTAVPGKLRAA